MAPNKGLPPACLRARRGKGRGRQDERRNQGLGGARLLVQVAADDKRFTQLCPLFSLLRPRRVAATAMELIAKGQSRPPAPISLRTDEAARRANLLPRLSSLLLSSPPSCASYSGSDLIKSAELTN